MRKRLLAWLLVMAILTGLVFPVPAFAEAEEDYEEPTSVYEEAFYINPLYADAVTEADLVQPEDAGDSDASLLEEDNWYSDINSAAEVILDGMKDRETTIKICYHTTDSDAYGLGTSIVETALAHTGNPVEGDYLRWQYAGYSWNLRTAQSGDEYYFTYIYTMTYYTTAEQEVELDSAVAALLAELNVSNATDYEKVQAVYSYIAGNVSYDYTNLTDENYKLKYTAYAALVNKTAVCQGYSCLLYRLLLDLGVDCRLITGDAGEAHAWNIIGLNGLYYYADSTWDSSLYPRTGKTVYFLKGAGSYFDQGSSEQIKVPVMNGNSYLLVTPTAHTADKEYTTEAFSAAYPMATEDYNPSTVHTHDYTATVTEPTCTESGNTIHICSCGDIYMDSYTAALGHENQYSDNGDGTHTVCCSRCDHSRIEEHGSSEEKCVCGAVIEVQPDIVYSGTCGDHLSWELDDVGTLTISGSGAMHDYSSSYDVPWYVYNNPITTVALPDGITSIGASAFSGCNGLTSISIPDTVTSIGKYAFECSSLTSVCIPDGVNSIGNGAFYDCSSLASVDIPASLTGIGNEAFYNCTALSSVTIPSGVTSIGDGAFWNCNSRIIAPMSACTLRAISGEGSFVGCNVLVTAGHSFDSGTDDTNGKITYTCTQCDCSYELSYAIDQDKNEAAVTGITCDADNTFAIRVVIPAEINGAKVVSIDNVVGLSSITEVVIPDGVTSIGDHAFSGCSGLTNVTIPEGVTSIGSCAFENCTSLTSLTLSASVTNIGVNSFGMKYSNVDQKYYPVRDLTAYVYPGTAAENYCKNNGVNYELVFHYSDDWSADVEKHWHFCTDEGFTDLKKDEAEHTWNDGVVTQKATQFVEGVLTYTCTICGETKDETIPVLSQLTVVGSNYKGIYDGSAHAISISVSGSSNYTIYYSTSKALTDTNYASVGSTTAPSRKTAGRVRVYYYVKDKTGTCGDVSGYNYIYIKPNVTATAYNGTYDGEAHSPVVKAYGSATVYYSTTTALTPSNYSTVGSTTVPSCTQYGTTTVYYIAVPSSGVVIDNVVQSGSTTITIKKPLTVTASDYKGTYDATAHSISISVSGSSKYTIYYSTSKALTASNYASVGSTTAPTRKTAGRVLVYYYVKDKTGTCGDVSGHNYIYIKPKVTATAYSGKYDGQPHSPVVKANGSATVYYSTTTALTASNYTTAGSTTVPTRTQLGTTNVYYIAVPNSGVVNNNVVKSGTTTITIKKSLVITASDYNGTYDGIAHSVSISVSGSSNYTIYYSTTKALTASNYTSVGSTTAPTRKTAGRVLVYYYIEDNSGTCGDAFGHNYIYIKPKVTATAYNGTYDGKAHSPVVKAYGSATVYYSTTIALTESNYTTEGSTLVPARTQCGTTTVYYIAVPNSGVINNNVVKSGSTTIEVSVKSNDV